MLIEKTSKYLLKKTRAKAKMIEYNIPEEEHVEVEAGVDKLFLIAVAAIGDISVNVLKNTEDSKMLVDEAKASLEFASKYFDAYLNTKLDEGNDEYYLLLGSVAYFLCDYVGSSKVLINKINAKTINFYSNGMEKALVALLKDEFHNYEVASEDVAYQYYLDFLKSDLKKYYTSGERPNIKNIYSLRSRIYKYGSDLELLLGDIFGAIFLLKIQHSAVNLLPQYMHIDTTMLQKLLFQSNAMKELWPAQRKIGEKGIFLGNSAVIQMPTSSGKTKSLSLIIASAFLSGRTRLAVVVAPFRALCREIRNDFAKDLSFDGTIHIDELSDVLQKEELVLDTYDERQKIVLISTPEKLIYLLRQRDDLIDQIGIIIFDEGHLFDEPKRGVVYELLISTIKSLLKNDVQKVLVSAIIPNSIELNNWLNGGDGIVISDNTIRATQKNVAINDWIRSESKHYGYLYFVNPENPDEEEFFVPRLVSITKLNKKHKEIKPRFFPEVDFAKQKVMYNDLAIFYSLTLCHNGGVGVFCGKKDVVNGILDRILEIDARGYNIDSLLSTSDKTEVDKICKLISDNYGKNNIYYLAGTKAAFAHHASISNGIKISIEHAMRNNKISFIVCTSTLSQGVNLPIRYLIVSSMYQGKNQMRVRDFHNLIGRVGRSGIFTEGTILLSESFVYNNRYSRRFSDRWKWEEYKRFIDNNNSEPCSSRILFLVKSYTFKQANIEYTIHIKEIIISYYNDYKQFSIEYAEKLNRLKRDNPSICNEVEYKINEAIESLGPLESFLMGYLLDDDLKKCADNVQRIVKETLAYNLATDEEKENLMAIFHIIAKYCVENIPETYQRYVCSRSLLSVRKMIYIQHWADGNITSILECQNTSDLLKCLFECLIESIDNKIFDQLESINTVLILGLSWIQGVSYENILELCTKSNSYIMKRRQRKTIDLDEVSKICDNVLGYESTVVLSAISEFVNYITEGRQDSMDLFKKLSSELKYGLPYGSSIIVYEIGFSDRVVSQKISTYFDDRNIQIASKYDGRKKINKYCKDIEKILKEYPSIYSDKLKELASIKS